MPRISVYFVRAALLHLVAGFTLGAWQLAAVGTAAPGPGAAARSLHVELLLTGWLLQLALGVALWIFPYSRDVSAWRPLWIALVLLNAGVLLAGAGGTVGAGSALLKATGRLAEGTAAVLVAWRLWPRTGPVRRPDRP